MDTRMLTNQVRMAKWSEIIKDRCESGLTIKEYCAERGISRDAYFYWLRKIRESAVAAASEQFAELLPPVEPPAGVGKATGVTIELNGAKIRVEDACSRNTLSMVLEVLRNVQ